MGSSIAPEKIMGTVKHLYTFLCLLLVTFPVVAYEEGDLEQLTTTNFCVECDLTKANLVGMQLAKPNLAEAKLNEASLSKANLSEKACGNSCISKKF